MIDAIAPAAWQALVAVCEAAWPDEACGWLGGDDLDGVARVVRAARPGGRDAFAFADDDLLALAAAYRHGPRPRVLFHSHPRGPATLSPRDREALAPGGVVLHPLPHVIVAVRDGRAVAATLYDWRAGAPVPAAVAERDRDHTWIVRAAAAEVDVAAAVAGERAA